MGIKTFRLFLLITVAILSNFSPAFADGNKLLRECQLALRGYDGNEMKSAEDIMDSSFCFGYLTGVVETLSLQQRLFPNTKRVCFPANVVMGQLVRVVVKSLSEEPENLHMPEALLVVNAFKKAFPCKD